MTLEWALHSNNTMGMMSSVGPKVTTMMEAVGRVVTSRHRTHPHKPITGPREGSRTAPITTMVDQQQNIMWPLASTLRED